MSFSCSEGRQQAETTNMCRQIFRQLSEKTMPLAISLKRHCDICGFIHSALMLVEVGDF